MASDPHKNKLGIIFNNFTWDGQTQRKKKQKARQQSRYVFIDFPNWNMEATADNIKESPTNRKVIGRKLWHVL